MYFSFSVLPDQAIVGWSSLHARKERLSAGQTYFGPQTCVGVVIRACNSILRRTSERLSRLILKFDKVILALVKF